MQHLTRTLFYYTLYSTTLVTHFSTSLSANQHHAAPHSLLSWELPTSVYTQLKQSPTRPEANVHQQTPTTSLLFGLCLHHKGICCASLHRPWPSHCTLPSAYTRSFGAILWLHY